MNFLDEKSSAVHCLGNLALHCPGVIQPYMERIMKTLEDLSAYFHENIRYHVCLTYAQIAMGLLKNNTGKADTDDHFFWKKGLPVQIPLPDQVSQFMDTVMYAHYFDLLQNESNKEVVEKVLECIRDITEEMGPAGVATHLDAIVENLSILLDKESFCQTRVKKGDTEEEQDEDFIDSEDDEEDLDHDEIILGNVTDLIITLSKALGDSFLPYLQKLGPKLVKYLGDEHPRSDKTMVIGCLAETFNQAPQAIEAYFNDYVKVLLQHSTSDNGSLNRNVAYGIGILAEKASTAQVTPHLQTLLQAVKTMYTNTPEEDAKDNCIATIVRFLEVH